jgi:hypothetical protein
MAMDGHGLPKASPGPAMPYPSTPCWRATPETSDTAVYGVARPQDGQSAASFYLFGHPTFYAYAPQPHCLPSPCPGVRTFDNIPSRADALTHYPKPQEKGELEYQGPLALLFCICAFFKSGLRWTTILRRFEPKALSFGG